MSLNELFRSYIGYLPKFSITQVVEESFGLSKTIYDILLKSVRIFENMKHKSVTYKLIDTHEHKVYPLFILQILKYIFVTNNKNWELVKFPEMMSESILEIISPSGFVGF